MELEFSGTDRFEVISRLGEGAMGVVYRAIDREKAEPVAIKTLRHLDGDGLLRFKNEFRAIQSLQHVNVISLGELVEARGRWFFTMELIDGTDFYSWVRPRRPRSTADEPLSSDDSFAVAPTARTMPAWMNEQGTAPAFDEERLRPALAQLAQGVAALHHTGLVHRDIKPSNVLVTREGRVVLLDFGFVVTAEERSSDRIVGTVAYMAPEQAASLAPSAASDWYSMGVMLYEALTGRTPIDGTPMEILMGKQHRQPVPPSQIVTGVPIDLEDLCLALLRVRPEERPEEAEILRRLGISAAPTARSSSIDLSRVAFFGRANELERLRAASRQYSAGRATATFVHGESGIGKSALVREFTRQLRLDEPTALILTGQCYERETVPYKAFDGVVDTLSRALSELPAVDAAMAVPIHVTPVAQVFPVLRRCEVIARAVRPLPESLEPAELRLRMFAGLRELLTRLASRRPVVIVIDDFQWADADSLALLRDLLRPPDAPHAMLVATVRTSAVRRAPGEAPFLELDTEHTEHIHLKGLTSDDARALARSISGHVPPDLVTSIESIVNDSGGHPLYIDEMMRYGSVGRVVPSGSVHLETVLWQRVLALEPPAREILEQVAISPAPMEKGVAATAARQSFADFSRWVSVLRVAKLVQTTGTRRADRIDVFHDRVRQAVLQNLVAADRRHHHERLALAHEATGASAAEALAVHWSGAGDRERAYQYTRLAAGQATEALAFDRAARLYRQCLEFVTAGSAEMAELLTLVGDALANAGQGAQAANAYLSAAEASPADAVELNASAAGHLLRSGHVDSGLEVLRRALAPLGLSVAKSPRKALLSLVIQRVGIALGGLRFRERPESELSRRELTRVDVSWALAAGFALIDVIRGAEVQARHMRVAFRTGEPYRIARAMLMEVAYRFAPGSRGGDAARRVLADADALAARLGNPPNLIGQRALVLGLGGILEGRWTDAEESCRRAEVVLRERGSGVAWELSSARLMHLWALWYLGRLPTITERLPALLREASDRGDLYASTSYRTFFSTMEHLREDRVEIARSVAATALARWSQQGFHFQHYFRWFASFQTELYAGEPVAALAIVEDSWEALATSLLLSVQQMRIEALHIRGRAELAVARHRGGDAKRLKRVERLASRIEKERSGWGDGLARLLRGGVAAARQDRAGAAALAREAAVLLEQRSMGLYAGAARWAAANMLDGEEAAALCAEAEADLHSRGVVNAPRMAAMLAPGFEDQERIEVRAALGDGTAEADGIGWVPRPDQGGCA